MNSLTWLLLIALAQGGASDTTAKHKEQTRSEVTQNGRNEKGATQVAPPHITIFPHKSAQVQADKKEREEADHAENERETFLAALGMFLLTGVVAYYAYGLFNETRLASKRGQRAYVGIRWKRAVMVSTGASQMVSVQYEVSIENVGETPALYVSCSTQLEPMAMTTGDTAKFEYRDDGDRKAALTLYPRDERTITAKAIEMTLNDWYAIKAGTDGKQERRLFCWGRLEYTDVFGKSHWANYCFYFGGPYSYMITGDEEPRAPRWHRHNRDSEGRT